MIRLLEHHEIDKSSWDKAVGETPDATVCSNSWFLDVVSPGWAALVEDEYQRIFPLTFARKYGFTYLRQPKFCQQLGVSGIGSQDDPSADQFISECMRLYSFCEINLRTGNVLTVPGANVISNRNLILDMTSPYETIRSRYSKNHIRNLKKSNAMGLQLVQLDDAAEVISIFRNNRGREVRSFNEIDYGMLDDLIKVARRNACNPFIAGVRSDDSGEILCGAIFMEYKDRSLFLFSGTGEKARQKNAMHYMIDEYIRSNSGRFSKLDFEGSNNNNLARFYSGFGAIETVYLHVRYNNLPLPFRWLKN